jgi:hypothetical protein
MTVQSGINIFLSPSSHITIAIKRASRCHLLRHSMDSPVIHRWAGLNLVKELFLVPTLWQRPKRRWDKSRPTCDCTILSEELHRQKTLCLGVWSWWPCIPLSLSDEMCMSFWDQREDCPWLHWSVSYPWEVWTTSVPSGATIKIVRCAQCLPYIPTQKMSEAFDQRIGPTRSSHTKEDYLVL